MIRDVYTLYLYTVAKLFNVRLDPARLRKVRRLRDAGIKFSDVVRDAIDVRYDEVSRAPSATDPGAVIASIFERYPDPPDLPAREYDVHDGRAARRAVLQKLKSRER